MILLSIDYDEPLPETYRGCLVTLGQPKDGVVYRFASDNFEMDLDQAQKFASMVSGNKGLSHYAINPSTKRFFEDLYGDEGSLAV